LILVVGATGYLGGLISRRLLGNGKPVRIVARPASDYLELASLGAMPIKADLKDAASLKLACKRAKVVISTANSARRAGVDNIESVDLCGNQNLIEAAVEAGVEHFIFISAYGASLSHPAPFLQAKARTEEVLRASGLSYTILSPHIFMDAWIPRVVGSALRENRPVLLVGKGERRHSFIAAADVAAFATATVEQTAENRSIPLGGPAAVSWRDIISLVESRVGQTIQVQSGPAGQPLPQLPDLIAGLLTTMEMADVEIPMRETAQMFGVELTSVEEFINRAFSKPTLPND
jgi:uncharacterized protein YbjT (DUF2867 family)